MVAGQVLGEPTALLETIFAEPNQLDEVRLFGGMSLSSVLQRAPANVALSSFVGMGSNAPLVADGRLRLIPCHMSELTWSLTAGPLRPDVALVLVSPPDASGNCSLGVVSDYIWAAVSAGRVVLAEINDNVPIVPGDTQIPFDRLDGYIYSDRPLPDYPRSVPSSIEGLIGERVAEFVSDGTCIQVGVGRLGEAVIRAAAQRRDLGIHTGMVGETILELMRDGVITNTNKAIDTGLTVTGSILGGKDAVVLAAAEPALRLRSVAHTHSAAVISAIQDFLCVNSAIEVDLLGQINAETVNGRYVGGIGGSVDFLRAAAGSPGGRSVVALPANSRGGISRIVAQVQHVTVARSDIDVVVTEHGTARLRGVSEGERAMRLIAVAAPEHREELLKSAHEMGL